MAVRHAHRSLRRRSCSRFEYVPAQELGGRPHVMVDGMPRPGTVCTLSHWPNTPTPEALRDDLSAGIVLKALARRRSLPPGVDVASVDHYDEDGVISLGLLCVDGLARAHAPLLLEAARVGDFGVVRDRRAALVSFALAALPGLRAPGSGAARDAGEDPGEEAGGESVMDRCARSARAALGILPELAARPDRFEHLWGAEAAAYDASVAALEEGRVTVEDHPEHDLAVVRVGSTSKGGARGPGPECAWDGSPLHRAALHSATGCLRTLVVVPGSYELRYRYESWVRLASRRPRLRVDLAGLADELSAAEPGPAELGGAESGRARWVFEGASALTPALHPADGAASALDPEWVVEVVCDRLTALDAGPPAWDPYRRGESRRTGGAGTLDSIDQ